MAEETFTPYQIVDAINEFLAYGEKTYIPSKPQGAPGHRGYFSGDGFAARALRYHAKQLNAAEIERRKAARQQNDVAQKFQQMQEFVSLVANFTADGDIVDGEAYMTGDDDNRMTLNNLIATARQI